MLFDLIDYTIGCLKSIIYCILYIGKYRFSVVSKISAKSYIRIYDKGSVILKKGVVLRSGSILRCHKQGVIKLGNGAGLNNNCLLTAFKMIEIGENTILGQSVKIYDHDHVFEQGGDIRKSGFTIEPVKIGKNVWIGSDCVILKGTTIGDNTVIAAGSIVNGDIPPNSLFIQKRNKTINKIINEMDNNI